MGPNLTDFLHHDQTFDVTIEKRDYDIKNSIVMHKAREHKAYLNWTLDRVNNSFNHPASVLPESSKESDPLPLIQSKSSVRS